MLLCTLSICPVVYKYIKGVNVEDSSNMDVSDEPPEPSEPPGTIRLRWFSRMVAFFTPDFSLCQGGTSDLNLHCVYRKHLGIMGFVEFYPKK